MLWELEGIVKMKECPGRKTVVFGILQKDVPLLLSYFSALDYGRLPAFVIKEDINRIKFTVKENLCFHILAGGWECSGTLTDNQRDLIHCCCIDNLLYNSYDHVDLEQECCDFVFRIVE